jgi:peptide chain release factor 2
MNELIQKIDELKNKFENIEAVFGLERKQKEISKLEKKSAASSFWDNQQEAAKILKKLEETNVEVKEFFEIKKNISELQDIISLAETRKDKKDIEKEIFEIEKSIEKIELRTLFTDKYDSNDAILSIYSGAGGVDAQDWSQMILRMYLRWAEKNNYKAFVVFETPGQEAGIKNATVKIIGPYAYGYLKSEAGVHRLVRLSPFNSDNLRQTSFSLVEILPVIDDVKEIEINPKDIKLDTFRSSGAGGQSVNKTSSAVRITHIPTGIVAVCQNERSQMQNREEAMKILRSRLYKKMEEERIKEKKELRGEQKSAEWGNQIRSYVIHPYKMVKDHRTKREASDVESVFGGDLKDFIESYLRWIKK